MKHMTDAQYASGLPPLEAPDVIAEKRSLFFLCTVCRVTWKEA